MSIEGQTAGSNYREWQSQPSLLPYAEAALAAGLAVHPVKQDGSKRPKGEDGGKWEAYQERLPTHEELVKWFRPRQRGIGVVTGKVSGNVEFLDFDRHDIFAAFYAIARGANCASLLDRMMAGYWEESPNGTHIPYRCETTACTDLAMTYRRNDDGTIAVDAKTGKPKLKVLIETKGEGGFIIIAPSHGPTHESGKPYTLKSGGPETIATITLEERETLFRIARSLTEIPEEPSRDEHPKHGHAQPSGARPGDLFAAQTGWDEILTPHGWVHVYTHNGTTYWRRPGKDRGISATTNHAGSGYFYCFSTSTAFEANRARGKFSAYALLNHNDDFVAAAEALMRQGFTQNGWGPTSYTNGHDSGAAHETGEDTTKAPAEEPEPTPAQYPCPDVLRRGIFATVSDKLGLWSWEVWLGTFAALSARAQKNLHVFYYSDPIFGNSYSLLVNRTAAGKNLVNNVTRALLADHDYKIRTGVSSGQGLLPLLTDDSLKSADGRIVVNGVPLLLLCAEWSRIAQMANIQNSVLWENLNELFMCHTTFSQSRSHKSRSGGDVVVQNPRLTIAGTTTRALFAKAATPQAIECGALNRYLIVPGNAHYVPYTGQNYDAAGALRGCLDQMIHHTFGLGKRIMDLYHENAWKSYEAFQKDFIVPLEDNEHTSLIFGRLHLHVHHAAALYAWSERSPVITLEHTQAAQALIRISHAFVSELLAEQAQDFEPTKSQVVDNAMERRAIDNVKKSPGLTRRDWARKFANDKGGYTAWVKVIETLLKAGALHIKGNGKREELFEGPGDEI